MRLLFGLALAWAAMLVFLPRNYCGGGSGKLARCKSNLRVIGTALAMYSTDWSGRYPRELAQLTPNYLKTMPTCPATEPTRILPAIDVGCCGIHLFEPPHLREIPVGPGYDTYIATYQATAAPDHYTMFCAGHHHPQIAKNFPRYTANEGLNAGWRVERKTPGRETGGVDQRTTGVLKLARLGAGFRQARGADSQH